MRTHSALLFQAKHCSLVSIIQHQLQLQPRTIFFDYEVTIRDLFPGINAKGCFFHYVQCIWRTVQELPTTWKAGTVSWRNTYSTHITTSLTWSSYSNTKKQSTTWKWYNTQQEESGSRRRENTERLTTDLQNLNRDYTTKKFHQSSLLTQHRIFYI